MKISKLEIKEFRHLKNLEFDFTYPSDYKDQKKAGKPLEKICFIGQSATGKTNLLELIYDHVFNFMNLETVNNEFIYESRVFLKKTYVKIDLLIDNRKLVYDNEQIIFDEKIFDYSISGGIITPLVPYDKKRNIIYFKSDLISEKNLDLFTKNPINLIEGNKVESNKTDRFNLERTDEYGLLFNNNVSSDLWIFLLAEILEYRKKFNQKMSELIHKGLLANQKRLSEEFGKWQIENPNTLEKFAEIFNPILKRLNLEVDIVDTEYSIPIRNKITDKIIPIQSASTGTKGLLLTILPLYQLNTDNTMILMDEPERSLYPDMQMDLIDYYQSLAPNAQFIIATHSPFIAASFEPEERFILYFDEKGKVKVRRGNSPIGDDPNDMLKNDFGVNYYNKHGKEAYQTYLSLKQKIANEENSKKKKELLLQMVKLGDDYNF